MGGGETGNTVVVAVLLLRVEVPNALRCNLFGALNDT
jgi:hypothetical protein